MNNLPINKRFAGAGSSGSFSSDGPYEKWLCWLIISMFLLRLLPAALLELGNDEVYYLTYTPHLQWNYFDHPPMVAVWIRIFTANLLLVGHELFVRLGSVFSCAVSTWFMYRIGVRLHSARAGFMIALLYSSSVYASIIAGTFIMPDGPQMLFWTWSLLQLTKLSANEDTLLNWLLFGLSSGFCMMSKIHAIFIFSGLFLFMVFASSGWFRQPALYLGVLIAALIFTPVIIWNFQHDFITYRYHSARVTPAAFSLHGLGFSREVFGQILYNNPVNVVLIFLALFSWKRLELHGTEKKVLILFNWIAVPMISVLLLVALFRDTLPHWSGPAYVTLIPLAGVRLAVITDQKRIAASAKWALGVLVFFIVLAFAGIQLIPGTIGNKKEVRSYGQNDITLDLFGWEDASVRFQQIYQEQVRKGNMPAGAPVVALKWFPAAHEDYYLCRPLNIPLIGLGEAYDLHQYLWLNYQRMAGVKMDKVWCIVPSNVPVDIVTELSPSYLHVRLLTRFACYRNGQICRYFSVYLLQGFKGKIPFAN